MKTLIVLLFLLFTISALHAQQSGNSIYNQNNNNNPNLTQSANKLYLSDSSFLISANVLLNIAADEYVVTFGVSEQADKLADCNEKIDKRIQSFIAGLGKLGIKKADVFVDMTTQTKVYDYKLEGNNAEQFLKGFELKKNVIINFKNIKDLDKMVIVASDYQIFDLIKVDYIVADINKIYKQLFKSATEIINEKKDLYVGATNLKLNPASEVYLESFNTYTPSQLYKSYVASESSQVYDWTYNNSHVKKDLMKSATYYYDHLNYSGFDKVINPIVVEPVVEFVLTLQIKYNIEKGKK